MNSAQPSCRALSADGVTTSACVAAAKLFASTVRQKNVIARNLSRASPVAAKRSTIRDQVALVKFLPVPQSVARKILDWAIMHFWLGMSP